jgi:hypothetical protein
MPVEEAIQHFRRGERVAAGSTQTHRGKKEISYWANPFPLLEEADGTVLHPELHRQFQAIETRFIKVIEDLRARNEMQIGIVNSQLMAGVYENNTDEDIVRCGYNNREEIEQEGPTRLARDLIEKIKCMAIEKRNRLGKHTESVSITIALVGDSRTGKSETAEKMEGILDLQLV